MNPSVFVIGDVHGHLEKLTRLLRDADLADANLKWSGGTARLWFTGDFTDRGPDGIGVIDLVMRLQHEAARVGGSVNALQGNHDIAIASAFLFPHEKSSGPGGTFIEDWLRNGGLASDLERLDAHHVEWLVHLSAMAQAADRLLVHADALFYEKLGETIEQVNSTVAHALAGRDPRIWDRLLGYNSERLAFDERREGGAWRAAQFLKRYGGTQIIHGHTPITMFTDKPSERITRAFEYAQGQCVDVDGGMYRGSPGFVYELAPEPQRVMPNVVWRENPSGLTNHDLC